MLELTVTQQVKPSISVNSKADVIKWGNIPYSSDNTKSFYSLYSPSQQQIQKLHHLAMPWLRTAWICSPIPPECWKIPKNGIKPGLGSTRTSNHKPTKFGQ